MPAALPRSVSVPARRAGLPRALGGARPARLSLAVFLTWHQTDRASSNNSKGKQLEGDMVQRWEF